MRQRGCRPDEHPRLNRREPARGRHEPVRRRPGRLLRLQRRPSRRGLERRKRSSLSSNLAVLRSTKPSTPSPTHPTPFAASMAPPPPACLAFRFCEFLPRLAQRADQFSIVRTMHHIADRQFRTSTIARLPSSHRYDRIAGGRFECNDHGAACGAFRVAVDWVDDRLRGAARARRGAAGGGRAAARRAHEVSGARLGPAGQPLRSLGRGPGAAVPIARSGRLVPQLLQSRRPERSGASGGQGAESVVGQHELPQPRLSPARSRRHRAGVLATARESRWAVAAPRSFSAHVGSGRSVGTTRRLGRASARSMQLLSPPGPDAAAHSI